MADRRHTGAHAWAATLGAFCVLAAALLATAPGARAALARVGHGPVTATAAGVRTAVAAGLRLHVAVTLTPRDPAALAAYARAVSTPGSAEYRRYLTPSEFGRRFGATPAQVAVVRAALRARGLAPGPASAGRLSIPVVATAAAVEHAFAVSLSRLSLPGRRAAITASAAPAFPARAARAVQGVVGLDTTAAPQPLLVRRRASAGARPLAVGHVITGGPQPCAQAQASAPGQSAYTADQLASAYGFSGLYSAGDLGAGVTVAVYELESDDPADIAAYQSCYGTRASISYVPVDGGVESGPGAGEAALDVENLIGIAPAANVLVYQGPNSNSGAPGSGPYDTFSAIVNQDRATVVTVSWGQCEPALGRADAAAENTLFQQAAVQGQSIVAAAGDSGAEDCDTGSTPPQTEPAVDDPSSQPFVTGVGGTTLQALGPRPTETVWNSGGVAPSGLGQPGAGGGGISSLWAMPAAQFDAAAGLGVQSPAAAGAVCGNSGGFCREVPDVAMDADPTTGYLIYWNGTDSVPGEPAGWQGIGGTSAAAPVWAALLALANAAPACAGARLGYADPALYRAAGSDYAGVFNDITTGENDFTAGNGGRYAAHAGYDTASGLGTPYASALVAGLCADTVRVTDPGAQRSAQHATVSLRMRGSGVAGSGLTWHATGLPPGLSLGSAGLITGAPRRTGTFRPRIEARDGQDASASVSVTWIVGGATRISRLTVTGSARAPQLAFTVTAGRRAPAIRTLEVTVPRGLRLGSRRAVAVIAATGGTRPLPSSVHVSRHSSATIKLTTPASSLRIVLGPAALSTVGGRLPSATGRSSSGPQLALTALDAGAGRSRVTAALP